MQIRLLVNILVLCLTLVSVLVVVKTFPVTSESFVRQAVSLSRFDVRQREANSQSYVTDDRDTPLARLAQSSPCANGQESGLALPSGFAPAKLPLFQAQLKSFLTSRKYRTLNWCEDKKLRDTGPFVNGVSYGVHPTVKIYYSPSVINWLMRRDSGQLIPDG